MNGVGDNKTLQSKTAQQGLKGRNKWGTKIPGKYYFR